MHPRKFIAVFLFALLLAPAWLDMTTLFQPLVADDKPKTKSRESMGWLTPEREAAVLTFVALHHGELGDLLHQLRDTNRKQYDRAMKDLHLASERLAQVRENDPGRYDLELRAWQVKSRIQLLTAKLTMSADDELHDQLRLALGQQYELRGELLRYERDRLREKVKQLDEDLATHDSRRDAFLAGQLKQATSHAANGKLKIDRELKDRTSRDKTSDNKIADKNDVRSKAAKSDPALKSVP